MTKRPHISVAHNRTAPPHGLDFWPTPHWVTRAFMVHALQKLVDLDVLKDQVAVDPCAGEGAMVEALREFFGTVHGGDVFPYDWVKANGTLFDFADNLPVPTIWEGADWYVFNPPFNAGEKFIRRALDEARVGVAVLHRPGLLQNPGRWERLWCIDPPTMVALFAERPNLVPGRLDPNGTTGRDYVVSVWLREVAGNPVELEWIPPSRHLLERREDYPEWPLSDDETPLLTFNGGDVA